MTEREQQLPLFRHPADVARDEAIARVGAAADDAVWTFVMHTIASLCLAVDSLTTDDIWAALEEAPDIREALREPRALGPMLCAARHAGWIRITDRMVKSRRKKCHARRIAVWAVVGAGLPPRGPVPSVPVAPPFRGGFDEPVP